MVCDRKQLIPTGTGQKTLEEISSRNEIGKLSNTFKHIESLHNRNCFAGKEK